MAVRELVFKKSKGKVMTNIMDQLSIRQQRQVLDNTVVQNQSVTLDLVTKKRWAIVVYDAEQFKLDTSVNVSILHSVSSIDEAEKMLQQIRHQALLELLKVMQSKDAKPIFLTQLRRTVACDIVLVYIQPGVSVLQGVKHFFHEKVAIYLLQDRPLTEHQEYWQSLIDQVEQEVKS